MGVFVQARPSTERRFLTFISPPVGPYTQALQDYGPADPEGALRQATIMYCARRWAQSMAMMRPQSYRGEIGMAGESEKVPVTCDMLIQPSADCDYFAFTDAAWMSLALRSNVFGIYVDRDKFGRGTQVELQHPDQVSCKVNGKGQYEYRIRNELMDPRDIWHKAINRMPGSRIGMSLIRYGSGYTRSLQAAERFGQAFFEDGAHPSGILTNKNANRISQDQAARVKSAFMSAVHGTREPVVLGGGWDYSQIQVNPQDSQFLASRNADGAEICRLFGMNPVWAGHGIPGGSITYQNVEQSMLDFLTYPMTPLMIQWERWMSEFLPRGQWVKLDTSPLLRTDFLTRWQAYHMAVGSRVVAQSEVRGWEDLGPLTPELKAEVDALVTPLPPPVAPVRQGE